MSEKKPTLPGNEFLPSIVVDGLDRVFAPFNGPNTIGNSPIFWIAFLLVALVALAYPAVTTPFRVLNTTGYVVWIFLALSLTLIWGYTGIFSFGQTAFFGLGGYTFGVVAKNLVQVTGATNLALLAAVVLPAVFAVVVGYFMFYGRVSGVYVAIITLAVTLILELLFGRTAGPQYTIGAAELGGFNGMTNIPSLAFGIEPVLVELDPVPMYYFVVGLLIAGYLALRYVVNSNYGYVLIAVRENEARTEMFGYDIRKIKLQAFAIGGAMAGLSGALFASWNNFISPPVMGIVTAALPVIWVTVGGRQTILGAIFGALGLQFLDSELAAAGSEFSVVALGVILLGVILYFSDGVVPAIASRIEDRIGSSPDESVVLEESDA
ncbi:ABC transporter permease subunit [Natronomonas sp.]|uniref:ABC transporter permease subunit n=1 Tax=Natronomonas sp. TaxID=2184060 RepID=UPI00262DD4B8|nr:urea ABC transporter permease [Natronomonas sp.]